MFNDDTGGTCPAYDMIRHIDDEVVNQCIAVTIVGNLSNETISSWNKYYTTISDANCRLSYKLVQNAYKTFVNDFNGSIQPNTMADLKKCLINFGNNFGHNIMSNDLQCPVKNMH